MALGQILRDAREAKGLSLSDVAQNTHLLVQVVEALEREDFKRIAAAIYGRGFVRLYADFLGLDPAPLVRDFMSIYDGAKPPEVKARTKPVSASKTQISPSPEDNPVQPPQVKIRSRPVRPPESQPSSSQVKAQEAEMKQTPPDLTDALFRRPHAERAPVKEVVTETLQAEPPPQSEMTPEEVVTESSSLPPTPTPPPVPSVVEVKPLRQVAVVDVEDVPRQTDETQVVRPEPLPVVPPQAEPELSSIAGKEHPDVSTEESCHPPSEDEPKIEVLFSEKPVLAQAVEGDGQRDELPSTENVEDSLPLFRNFKTGEPLTIHFSEQEESVEEEMPEPKTWKERWTHFLVVFSRFRVRVVDGARIAFAHSRQILLAAGALAAVLLLAFGIRALFVYSERMEAAELPHPGDRCDPPPPMYAD